MGVFWKNESPIRVRWQSYGSPMEVLQSARESHGSLMEQNKILRGSTKLPLNYYGVPREHHASLVGLSRASQGTPTGLPRGSHGTPMGAFKSQENTKGNPTSMEPPWGSYGSPMEVWWKPCGSLTRVPRKFNRGPIGALLIAPHGSPIGVPWEC